MFKDYEDLYVLDIIEPILVIGDSFEEAEVFKNCICRKEIVNENEIVYRDLKRNRVFNVSDKIGVSRVDEKSIISISSYYNFLGIPKICQLNNKKSVRSKVKTLKRERKL